MPIYEYYCPACNKRVEKFIRGQAGKVKIPESFPCDECGQPMVRLIVSQGTTWKFGAEPFYDDDFKDPKKEDI